MEARVRSDSKLDNVFAFSGREFSKTEWRPVPAGLEEEAKANPFLEVRGGEKPAAKKSAEKAEVKGKGKTTPDSEGKGEGTA